MLIVKNLADIPDLALPLGLTIGSFDGVHLGHLYLIEQLKKNAKTTAVFTFSNHPTSVLKHRTPFPLVCTLEHKLALFEKAGVDLVILLPFTEETVEQTYDQFVKNIRKFYPFSLLVIGEGDAFGKNRAGDELHVKELGKELGFQAEYPKKIANISSGAIRRLITSGDIKGASELLGRPYSIYTRYDGKEIPLEGLCLLPEGDYPVTVVQNKEKFTATGHLTHTPPQLRLEFGKQTPASGFVEIFF